MSSIKKIADQLGLDQALVTAVLKEQPGVKVTRETADKIFMTARKLGYDLKKLKLGKRMQVRKETIEETLNLIAENPSWGRAEIVKYLKEMLGMVERVHKRVFREEYGEDWL
jgi:DNA-binding LacI/PurR family transcriptional regulator